MIFHLPNFKTEIMYWGGVGSGTTTDPKWGAGDLKDFGLVGVSNGCVNVGTWYPK